MRSEENQERAGAWRTRDGSLQEGELGDVTALRGWVWFDGELAVGISNTEVPGDLPSSQLVECGGGVSVDI